MKIGSIEVKRIPPSQNIECVNGSSNAIAYFNETPYCAMCLAEEQRLKWNQDGQFFMNDNGERVYLEVVERIS